MAKIRYKWATNDNCGGDITLFLINEKEISHEYAEKIIKYYDWYRYDNRIDGMRYIRKMNVKNVPQWLTMYIVIKLWEN